AQIPRVCRRSVADGGAPPRPPESRTMQVVGSVPPLSPVVDVLTETGHDGENSRNLFGAIDALRIPVEYLAELFTAGDVGPVRAALQRLATMGSYLRAANFREVVDATNPPSVPVSGAGLRRVYRLPTAA